MLEIEIKDINNNAVGKVELPEEIFGLEPRKDILHAVVVNYLANQRQGTHATKTRGLVRGGGKKPWKQKHTGRARHGSIRSPLWKGGGTTFGPQPRDYSYKVNKKLRRLALRTALSVKFLGNEIVVIDDLKMERPKSADIIKVLSNLALMSMRGSKDNHKKILIVLPEKNDNIVLSARNIVGVDVVRAMDMNTYDVLNHDMVLMTSGAITVVKGLNGDERPVLDN
ncbi:MAG: 50S ribosomal protein L4 [Nitrospirae bacterium]|nr:50S ribosomal protein L4 [Nitrospirota bacterium]